MSKRPYRFHVYKLSLTGGHISAWSWRLKAPNGRIIATPHDSYATRSHAIRSARDVMLALQVRDVVCP